MTKNSTKNMNLFVCHQNISQLSHLRIHSNVSNRESNSQKPKHTEGFPLTRELDTGNLQIKKYQGPRLFSLCSTLLICCHIVTTGLRYFWTSSSSFGRGKESQSSFTSLFCDLHWEREELLSRFPLSLLIQDKFTSPFSNPTNEMSMIGLDQEGTSPETGVGTQGL